MIGILKYVHNHIREPLLAENVAVEFGYSRCYFCERFKEFTGRTFVEYVRHYRIQMAALDILAGEKVLDVAVKYGYDGASGFNKAFLKEYGCNPTEYRKQAKESQLYYEKRRMTMFQLSDRCAMLREEVVNRKHYMDRYVMQRKVYFALGEAAAIEAGKTNVEITADGITNVLENFHPVIIPGEIIVGFNIADAKNGQEARGSIAERRLGDGPGVEQRMAENEISPRDAERYLYLLENPPVNPNTERKATLTET